MFRHLKWKEDLVPTVLTGYMTRFLQEMKELWHFEVHP